MPKFKYTAMTTGGKEKKGVVEAATEQDAKDILKGKQLFVTTINQVVKGGGKSKGISFGAGRMRTKDLVQFTRNMSTLLDAGMPLLRSLRTLQRQAEKNPGVHKVVSSLADNVEGGTSMTEAMSAHPKSFNRLYVNMIKAGEASGNLETVLGSLADFLEKNERIKGKIKGASMYPLVVMVVALFIIAAMMIFIVPKFKDIFATMLKGAPLPKLTQFVLGISDAIMGNPLLVAGIVAAVVIVIVLALKTGPGQIVKDWLSIKLPVIKGLAIKTSVGRFARTLATLQRSGVSILQSLQIVHDTTTNHFLAKSVKRISESVTEGESIAKPMQESGVYPDIVVSMVEVGEETGELPEMLQRVADNYETEVDTQVDAVIALIEPLLIVCLAVVVGTVVFAMFLPMMDIITKMGGS